MSLEVYLASILLERNRWGPLPRYPHCQLSEWLPQIAEAGFDGIELWENHWTYAGLEARAKLVASHVPIRLFNSYLSPSTANPEEISQLASALRTLGAIVRGVKFNLADRPARTDVEFQAALRLAQQLPPGMVLYCECHADSVVDTPESAAAAFSVWPPGKFAAILHPFQNSDGDFAKWLRLMIPHLAHLHLQMRDPAENMICLTDRADFARQRLRALLKAGFRGSMSLEFTGGTGQPDEDIETLWTRALGDLALIRRLVSDYESAVNL
jgi:sugar phosphate isomerase/epimerase